MHTNQWENNRWAELTSSLVALVARPVNSLRTFLLLPEPVRPLICNCGDWTLHGARRNLCLLLTWKWTQIEDRQDTYTKTTWKILQLPIQRQADLCRGLDNVMLYSEQNVGFSSSLELKEIMVKGKASTFTDHIPPYRIFEPLSDFRSKRQTKTLLI